MRLIPLILLAALTAFSATAADLKPFTPEADLGGDWTFKVDERLPNVLLLGDSISIGYTRAVRQGLAGKANVFRPMNSAGTRPANCGETRMGLKGIDRWLGERHWDVIHFNWGLWDLCYRNPQAKTQGQRDKAGGTLTTSPEEYERNLETLVTRLERTGAKLIWASTTAVPPNELGRFEGDDLKYNAIAARVMKRHGIATDDLYAVTKGFGGKLSLAAGDVHYTPEGYQRIADAVSAAIAPALPPPRR